MKFIEGVPSWIISAYTQYRLKFMKLTSITVTITYDDYAFDLKLSATFLT